MRPFLIIFLLLAAFAGYSQSKKWADSMGQAIYKMENDTTWHGGDVDYEKALYKHMRRYMQASIALGNYYQQQYNAGKEPDLSRCMKYYWPITMLRSGTDSDIGYDSKLIAIRERLAMKLANLYNTGKIKGGDTLENYVIARYLKEPVINVPQQMDWIISDDTSSIVIKFFKGSFTLCNDAKAILRNVAALMKMYPDKRMAIFGNGNFSYYSQQLSYEQSEAVITYLTEQCDIKRERFIQNYGQPGERNLVQMRFTLPGEAGQSKYPPPTPGMRY